MHLEFLRDLRRCRLPAELDAQLALGAQDLVQLLDDVHGNPDRPPLVGERTRDRLADPPGRVRGELEALAVVELLGGAHEADRPLLDQVEERQPLVAVALRDRDDKPEVRFDHLPLRTVVAALDPLRELDLLGGGEQVDLSDALEKDLQRIRGRIRQLLEPTLAVLDGFDRRESTAAAKRLANGPIVSDVVARVLRHGFSLSGRLERGRDANGIAIGVRDKEEKRAAVAQAPKRNRLRLAGITVAAHRALAVPPPGCRRSRSYIARTSVEASPTQLKAPR